MRWLSQEVATTSFYLLRRLVFGALESKVLLKMGFTRREEEVNKVKKVIFWSFSGDFDFWP